MSADVEQCRQCHIQIGHGRKYGGRRWNRVATARAGPRGVRGRGQDGKVGPPVDPVTRRGSGGITPGKFLKIYVNFGAIWCIFAPLAESLDSPVLQQNFKVCDSL